MAVSSVYRCRTALRSIAGSLLKPKPLDHAQRNVADKPELVRAVTTSADAGDDHFKRRAKSATICTQMEIIVALSQGERSRASKLLLGLAHGNHSLNADDFIDILKYCAKSPDPLFVMETWKIMEEKEIAVNDKCHVLKIQSLCKGGFLDEAYDFINFLGETHGVYPSLPVYNSFLSACANVGSIIHANKCLDQMEQRMIGKNEATYLELLKLAVWQQSLPAVHDIWKEYSENYSLSIFSLRKFICSFARLGDMKFALEILQRMVSLAINKNFFVGEMAHGKFNSSSSGIPVPLTSELSLPKCQMEENAHSASSVNCKEMDGHASNVELPTNTGIAGRERGTIQVNTLNNRRSAPVMKILSESFNDLIHACAQSQNCSLAEELMLQMQNLGLEPTSRTYDGFIRAIVFKRGCGRGLEVLQTMLEKNLKPYDSTLATISISCSQALELDLAEYLLNQISECENPLPFNVLLVACDKMDQPERATRVLAEMRRLKPRGDIKTYEVLFSLFGNVNAPYELFSTSSQVDAAKRIKAIELDMEKNGIQHSLVSMKNVLKALGQEGMIKEMMDYLFVAENLFCNDNTNLVTEIYNTVLHSLVDARDSHMAVKLFRNMKSSGVLPDAATYNIMINCCSNIKCIRSSRAILCMMIRGGYNPQNMTYTTMIKVLMECEEFDEALKLLDQACSGGIQLDVILFNAAIRIASERGRIDVVELVVQQMHQKNIRPDPSTCYHVFSAYTSSGFLNTALEALQVLSMRMICKDNNTLQEKKREYEDKFIYSEDEDVEELILEFFEGSEEYVAVGLFNLRWCAMLGCSISWLPDQSLWARRLSTRYHASKEAKEITNSSKVQCHFV